MNKPKQLIIIGGGASIKEGIEKGLWTRLKRKFVFGINYSYNFFPDPTVQLYLDKQVREKNEEDYNNLPLVITKKQPVKNRKNEIQIVDHNCYTRNLTSGVYKGSLTGIYAISMAIHLLDEGEIFLLGYDYGGKGTDTKKRNLTHFYQGQIEHRGVGKVNYYNSKGRASRDFDVFKGEKKVKIYNVSLDSKIETFDKISYNEFFKKLGRNKYNQEELRKYIIELTTPLINRQRPPRKKKKNRKRKK